MPILVTCQCGKKFRADEKHAGKQRACPKCGQSLSILGPVVSAYDVFVSYSHKDKKTCDALVAAFENKALRCWVAPRDILPGMNWGEAIISGIEQCRAMVLIFSGHSNESAQVKREVERAVNKGMPVIPLRIEDVKLSRAMEYFISSQHWLDALTPPLEKHLEELARKVMRLLTDDGTSAADPSRSIPMTIPAAIPIGEWAPPAPEPTSSQRPVHETAWPATSIANEPSSHHPNSFALLFVPRRLWARIPILGRWIAVGGTAAVLAFVVFSIFRPTAAGTIKLEIPNYQAGLTVQIDGETIDPSQLKNPLRLNVGSHRLEVVGQDIEATTKSFMVAKGENPPLEINVDSKLRGSIPNPPAAPIQVLESGSTNSTAAAAKSFDPVSDLAAMQGSWRAAAEEYQGAQVSPNEFESMKKTLKVYNNNFVIERSFPDGSRKKLDGTLRIVPGTFPKQFDWTGTDFAGNPLELLGLYELDADTLRIVYTWRGRVLSGPRPTIFASAGEGSGSIVNRFQRTNVASEPDWSDLFNGQDLTGWTPVGNQNGLSVKDKILSIAAGSGSLMTNREFADFELDLEYRISNDANSGIILRAPANTEPRGSQLLEILIQDDTAASQSNAVNTERTGAVFHVVPVSQMANALPNTWNRISIRAIGPQITVAVNGQKVVDRSLDEFADQAQSSPNILRQSGRIGLQHRTGERIEFRNIRLRDYSAKSDSEPGVIASWFGVGEGPVVRSMAFSVDGRHCLIGHEDNALSYWDVATGQRLHIFKELSGPVDSISFSPDGGSAISVAGKTKPVQWDLRTFKSLREYEGPGSGWRRAMFAPDGQHVLVGCEGSPNLIYWDTLTGKTTAWVGHDGPVIATAFSGNGQRAISGDSNGGAIVWSAATGEKLYEFKKLEGAITCVRLSPDGLTAFTGNYTNVPRLAPGFVRVWSLQSGQPMEMRRMPGTFFEISADGTRVLGNGEGNAPHSPTMMLDFKQGQWCESTYPCESPRYDCTVRTMSADGTLALIAGRDRRLLLWRLPKP